LALSVAVFGQGKKGGGGKAAADPITGSWSGDWGPSAADRNTVTVDLKLSGTTVTGTVHSVNFQRPDVEIKNGTFDPKAGTVHMEADAQGRGGPTHFVIDGKVDNGTMSGSWNHGATKGDFKLTKK
jgi:hypothetical protein